MLKKSDDDPNVDIINLLNIITETANKYAPFRTLSRKQMKLKIKPWLTKGLLNSIATKHKLFQQCYKRQNIDLISKYKSYRNKLSKVKEMAKRTYYQNEGQMHEENISKQWRVINEIICYKKKKKNTIAYH